MSTNKKNLIISFVCCIITLILLIEYLCGLEIAIYCLCGWTMLSCIIHINMLRDYVVVHKFVKKDYTK